MKTAVNLGNFLVVLQHIPESWQK